MRDRGIVRLSLACLPVIACASQLHAQASPAVTSFRVQGTVAPKCTLQNVAMNPSVTVASNGAISLVNPSSWTLSASCSGPSTLAVTAGSLRITLPKLTLGNNEAQTINYTATASGWTGTAATVSTADTALGSASYSLTGTARTRATAGTGTITVTYGAFSTPANGSNTKPNAGSYSSTITLSLAPAN